MDVKHIGVDFFSGLDLIDFAGVAALDLYWASVSCLGPLSVNLMLWLQGTL